MTITIHINKHNALQVYFVYLLVTQRFSLQQILVTFFYLYPQIPSNKCWPNRPIRKQLRDHRSKFHLSFVSTKGHPFFPAKKKTTPHTGHKHHTFRRHLRTLQDLFLQVLNLHDAAGLILLQLRNLEKTY